MSGKLYLVPTPIGNLEDITLRALHVLKSVDLILAEDTRTSQKLMQYYTIQTPLRSYHQHNEHRNTEAVIHELKSGKTIAQISDAGTPGISDPGFLLVQACIENQIPVECLPGACAFVPALILSALPNHRFKFCGFLPVKKGRKALLEQLSDEQNTLIFYESPHKIATTLRDLIDYFGTERKASLSRELTKLFEETIRGTLAELLQHTQRSKPKGEMVLVVNGKD